MVNEATSNNVQSTSKGNPDEIVDEQSAIVVEHLVKCYARSPKNAVDDISFNVRRGEIFGLLGPNGAGKTTTIGVLTTYVRPTSGTIRVAGLDVTANAVGVKQRIGVMPQRRNLDRHLLARENLTFHAAYHGVPGSIRSQRADELLRAFSLSDRANDKVDHYSGGMAQRLLIARAMMHDPEVLFLDEPTSGLDPQSRLFVWDQIRALRDNGVTILLTTQAMEEADTLCQRIAILDRGHILALDTAENLKKKVPGGSMLELHVRLPERASAASGSTLLDELKALSGVLQVDQTDESAQGAAWQQGWGDWQQWQNRGNWGGNRRGGRRENRRENKPEAKQEQKPEAQQTQDWSQWQQAESGARQENKSEAQQTQDWSQWHQGGQGAWQQGGQKSGGEASEQSVVIYRLYTTDLSTLVGPAVQTVLSAGAELRDLHVARPSLENVFIYLTGRALR